MKVCPNCRGENPDQTFCGACGAHLDLKDYIAASIKQEFESRDKALIETDVTYRALERVQGMVKNAIWIIGVPIAIVGLLGVWKYADFWSSVNAAKQNVQQSSNEARDNIKGSAAGAAKNIAGSAALASKQSGALGEFASKAKADVSTQQQTLTRAVNNTRRQLADAGKLQPQMTAMQKQLSSAVDQLRGQQKIISSSEEFVKEVFSSHASDIFTVGHEPSTRLAMLAPPPGGNKAVVFFLGSAGI